MSTERRASIPGWQVLILPRFKDFPSSELTVEFWMWSSDGCRQGVPFSYALGDYNHNDNAFLLFDYNNWCARKSFSRIRVPPLGPMFLRSSPVHVRKFLRGEETQFQGGRVRYRVYVPVSCHVSVCNARLQLEDRG